MGEEKKTDKIKVKAVEAANHCKTHFSQGQTERPSSAGRCGKQIKKQADKWSGCGSTHRFKPQQLVEKRENIGFMLHPDHSPAGAKRQCTGLHWQSKKNLKGFNGTEWESWCRKAPGRGGGHIFLPAGFKHKVNGVPVDSKEDYARR